MKMNRCGKRVVMAEDGNGDRNSIRQDEPRGVGMESELSIEEMLEEEAEVQREAHSRIWRSSPWRPHFPGVCNCFHRCSCMVVV